MKTSRLTTIRKRVLHSRTRERTTAFPCTLRVRAVPCGPWYEIKETMR